MTQPYPKPHQTYAQQLALLRSRGLECVDSDSAEARLRSVGYYRLSAYVYPFRDMLPPDQQLVASPTHYRAEVIKPGTTFQQVEDLWTFDRKLRLLILDAVEVVEIGLRTQVAYVLGARDMCGHLNRSSLNEKVCDAPHWRDGRNADTAHEVWLANYDARIKESAKEDFIRHNMHKYDELPIWIAVETMTFGALVRLFNLMRQDDQTAIARELGIKGGSLLGSWLEAINYLRNVAAHHSRLWNRTMTYKVRKVNRHQVGSDLSHIADMTPGDKIYPSLAITAYLVRHVDGTSNWPLTLRTHVNKKFPLRTGLTPADSMGFPEAWESLDLWTRPSQ